MRVKLSYSLSLSEIRQAVNGQGAANATVEYITTDTRELMAGDLFIALDGKSYRGDDFIPTAKARGAYSIGTTDGADIRVRDGIAALLNLAYYYKERLEKLKYTVAITGSVGKTTTKEFLRILLCTSYTVHSSDGNHNNLIGMPMSILASPADTEILVLEMGMNAPGEIRQMSECARPDIGVITNVGTAHIGRLGSREAIAKAKLELLSGLSSKLIVPHSEPLLSVEDAILFSTDCDQADLYLSADNGLVTAYHRSRRILCAPFFSADKRHLACLAPAVLTAIQLGVDEFVLSEQIPKISGENTRQSTQCVKDINIICDFYNASYEAFIGAIDALCEDGSSAEKGVLIGDMLELGEHFDTLHESVGAYAVAKGVNHIFAFGNCCDAVMRGALKRGFPEDRIYLNNDMAHPERTAAQILLAATPGESILFKASRGVRLEHVLRAMQNDKNTEA